MVLFGPIAETLLLALTLKVLLRATTKPLFAAAVSALLWGALHATKGALWFFGPAWSFFVFSCAFLGWRQRSFLHAFAAAAVPHALINLSVMAFLALLNVA
jgi:membrane protease YdiL (CAAX protease family)